jgi:hypothetical protein
VRQWCRDKDPAGSEAGDRCLYRQWRHEIVTYDDADCRMKSGILNRCRGWCIR